MDAAEARKATSLKYASLLILCLQNSLLAILMRLSRVGDFPQFNKSTAVFTSEILKLIVCIFVLCQYPPESAGKGPRSFDESLRIIFHTPELLRVSVPAFLYVIQNNLQYVAATNLDAAAFQIFYQLKILTTALFSVTMLGKKILPLQWTAIVVLMAGVSLVQLDDPSSPSSATETGPKTESPLDHPNASGQNRTLGLIAVLAACCCSGFAGVYFERILKNSGNVTSLWERNTQMGVASVLLAGVGLLYNDWDFLQLQGFFYGYRPVVWAAICTSAFGGLLTAVVVKYADNILKGFATSIAVVLSVIMSIFIFDTMPTVQFVIGAALVNFAVYAYSKAPQWQGVQDQGPSVLPRDNKDTLKQ